MGGEDRFHVKEGAEQVRIASGCLLADGEPERRLRSYLDGAGKCNGGLNARKCKAGLSARVPAS